MSEQDDEQRWFTRPAFLASAAFVILLAAIAGGVTIAGLVKSDREEGPTQSQASTPAAPTDAAPSPTQTSDESICGLEGAVTEPRRMTAAPSVQWAYDRTVAYPTSDDFGPKKSNDEGVRYCYQRSPEGALLAAANGATQATDADRLGAWLDYSLASGPYRDQILAEAPGSADSGPGSRLAIRGFKLLDYTGDTARVDLALEGVGERETVTLSMIYTLVWENGDWKLQVDDPEVPIDVVSLPSLTGYIPWEA